MGIDLISFFSSSDIDDTDELVFSVVKFTSGFGTKAIVFDTGSGVTETVDAGIFLTSFFGRSATGFLSA
jgi:hypothetical protein